MGENGAAATRDEVLAELRSADKLIVVTHENLDGDALGSLIAMQEILASQGRDSLMFIDETEFPLPHEYRFFALSGLVQSPPADLEERTIVFLRRRARRRSCGTSCTAWGRRPPSTSPRRCTSG